MKTLFLDESGDHNLSVIDAGSAIVESKFRRSPHGRIEGYGLMVLPK